MSLAFALVVGAVIVAWWGPVALRLCFHRVADPLAVLLGWLCLPFAVLATFGAAVAVLLAPSVAHDVALRELAQFCWHWARPSRVPALDEALGMAGALTMLVVLARFAVGCGRRARTARRTRRVHADLMTLSGLPPDSGGVPVLWIPHPTPLAYSVGGSGGVTVVATSARDLPSDQLAAVLSHERAHLRERHHLLVSVVEGLAAAMPWLPLTREAPSAVRLLVELRADAAAVRECGQSAVRAALLAFAGAPHPPSTLSMAGAETAIRLRRLQEPLPRRRSLIRGVLASMALTAPMGIGLFAAVITCI
ncbi:M56 family metallopeptidase [Micromonospora sp. NPDC047548]|uniref:M56 family metallopeptidase n=1 Tax=Micromonospora sp. NPDC047548 TaxID=3155624 RepID=UPI0033D72449